jgi:signal peptidase
VIGWVGRVIAWLVILGLAAIISIAVLVPRIAGATPYVILTGSMRPTLPPGTLVVVKPVDVTALRVGDVVTYQLESGEPAVVTHRVTGIATNLRGETRFITQGDANNAADPDPILPVQIKGKLWYSAPYLGHVNQALTGNQRQVATYGVAGLLLLYAAYMFIGPSRGRRKKHKSSEEVAS